MRWWRRGGDAFAGAVGHAKPETGETLMERLKVLDAEFLHMEDDCTPMHIACLCIFEGPVPSRDEVARLMTAKLALIPRYRKRLRFLPLEIGRPVWVDDGHFDLGYHVRRTALPAPGDDDALRALMGRLVSQRLDRERPLWELWIVEGLAQGRWALVSKVHHSMVDGISGVDLLTTVLDDAPDRALPEPQPWTPGPEPSRLALMVDAWRGLAGDAAGVAATVADGLRHPSRGARDLRDRAVGLAAFGRRLATWRKGGSTQGAVGQHRAYAHATVSLADVQAIRAAFGGTVNDVVLAVLGGGYRMLMAERRDDPDRARLRSLVPVSVRAPEARGVLDNRVSAVLCDLPVHVADPVDRLLAVRAEMDRLKASHMAEAGALVIELGELAPPFLNRADDPDGHARPAPRSAALPQHGHDQRAGAAPAALLRRAAHDRLVPVRADRPGTARRHGHPVLRRPSRVRHHVGLRHRSRRDDPGPRHRVGVCASWARRPPPASRPRRRRGPDDRNPRVRSAGEDPSG